MAVAAGPPRWPVVYGGFFGRLLALLVLTAVLVLWLTSQLDPREAALVAALSVALMLA